MRSRVLSLYRVLLKEAKRFPSIKKEGIYQDIRAEFRENASSADPVKVAQFVEIAEQSLFTMLKYTRLEKNAPAWQVELAQDPLGVGKYNASQNASAAMKPDESQFVVSGPVPTRL